jgi:hypothetical protein
LHCDTNGNTDLVLIFFVFLTNLLEIPEPRRPIPNPPAILFAKAGANIIISARRPEKLSEVRQAAQQAHKEGGTGQGGKVFEWVQDVQDRRGVDSESPLSPYVFCGLA